MEETLKKCAKCGGTEGLIYWACPEEIWLCEKCDNMRIRSILI